MQIWSFIPRYQIYSTTKTRGILCLTFPAWSSSARKYPTILFARAGAQLSSCIAAVRAQGATRGCSPWVKKHGRLKAEMFTAANMWTRHVPLFPFGFIRWRVWTDRTFYFVDVASPHCAPRRESGFSVRYTPGVCSGQPSGFCGRFQFLPGVDSTMSRRKQTNPFKVNCRYFSLSFSGAYNQTLCNNE